MEANQNLVRRFKEFIKEECAFANVNVNIRKIVYSNDLLTDGVAYIQDITINNRIDQYMLDSGGNFWYNYECIGPKF
jgi:hypothetical protein